MVHEIDQTLCKATLGFGAGMLCGQLYKVCHHLVRKLTQVWMPASAAAQKPHAKSDTILACRQKVAVSVEGYLRMAGLLHWQLAQD